MVVKVQLDTEGMMRVLPFKYSQEEFERIKDLIFELFPDAEIEQLDREFSDKELFGIGKGGTKEKWTGKDHEFLLLNIQKLSDYEIGKAIGRSGMGVYMQKGKIQQEFNEWAFDNDKKITKETYAELVKEFIAQKKY